MSYFEMATEQLEFDLSRNQYDNPWTPKRIELLHELMPKCSAFVVADRINQETGSTFTRNAIIGKACREGLKFHISKAITKPRVTNPGPRAARMHPVLKIAPVVISGPPEADEPNMRPMSYFDEWPNNRCRYGIGEPRSPDFYFCGADDGVNVVEGKAFCRFHAKLCYSPPRPVLRAAMAGPRG